MEGDEMKDRERTNFEEQIQEIFGTTDIEWLRVISENARRYSCMAEEQALKKHASGRKNSFTQPQIAEILALQDQGEKIASIARKYQVSRQTIYSQIKRAHHFSDRFEWKAFNGGSAEGFCFLYELEVWN